MRKINMAIKENKIKVDRETYDKFCKSIEKLEDELHIVNLRKRAAYCDAVGEGCEAPEFQNLEHEALRIRGELVRRYNEFSRLEIAEQNSELNDENVVAVGDVVCFDMIDSFETAEFTVKLVVIDGKVNDKISEVSTQSIVGGAILGKKVNDKFSINLNGEEIEIFVKAILEKGNKQGIVQEEKPVGPVRKRNK